MGFLDGVFGGDNKSNKKGDDHNNNNKKKDNNPLANAFARVANATTGGGPKSFQGQGKSLGGSKPGEFITVTLSQPGPLGVRVERKSNTNASAIVNEVIPGSQAEAAGLQRGDILCFAGTNGQDEIMYDMFLQLAQSGQRPLHLEARRMTATTMASANSKPAAAAASSGFQSADAELRRQAMIAAAEAREKAHRSKTKTIKHVTKSTLEKQKQLENNNNKDASVHSQKHEPLSDAARIAAQAAKQDEAALAAQLGYNPYQTAKATAGQARNATTTVQHGTINAGAAGNHLPTSSSSSSSAGTAALPIVAPPSEPTTAAEDDVIPNDVEEALATVLSSNNSSAISILTKLIVNATTKGQDAADEDAAAKFRKVRLSNPKIKAAVVDVTGALDLMMSVGFQLLDDDGGESCLVFPPHYQEPTWLATVLKRMEQ
ncbi:PUB domain containing protein [Nitzschia inconspicua]|uniref:PUB domain containing protein n=1 Tax=Nitzschia inconspicua TaxID=303405 RepID=A0A9K3M5Q8_9STRA|nr:PUB domain containing protein [Nitzschia inconspicua]